MMEILVSSFAVLRAVSAVPREDFQLHVKGFSSCSLHTMPCKREGKHQEDAHDMSLQGLTFFPPYVVVCLIGQYSNISEASCLFLPY